MTAKTCPRCGTVYPEGGRFCPRDGAVLRTSAVVDLVPGAIVHERYEIRRTLGSGGMGVVYLANDIHLERLCALKVLHSGAFADAEASARFYREATNASRISHPHVVAVYDFDETDDGLTYLATEYVEGRSLARMLEELSVLSPRPAARIVWQVANALHAAHQLKIVHRDVKPGNIMLTRYGEWNDFVKVVDFGIAKAFGTASGSSITTHGKWVGTPAYMSPEQWLGADIDHRSDIYSLALIAVRMLAGGLPTDRPAVPRGGAGILDALPPNDWPEAVRSILERALAVRPDERYQTVTDFSAAFAESVSAWVPPEPGVREPWEARIDLPVRAGAHAASAEPDPAGPPRESGGGPRPGWRRSLTIVAVGLIVLSGGVYTATHLASRPPAGEASPQDSSLPLTAVAPAVRPDSASHPPRAASEPSGRQANVPPRPEPARTGDSRTGDSSSIESSMARLAALIDPSGPNPDSMRQALALTRRLLDGPLTDDARLEVMYHRAEANLYLGNVAEACRDLREILPAAERSGVYGRGVRLLLDRSCEPGAGLPPS